MRTSTSWLATAVVLAACALVAPLDGCYSPVIEDGTLRCAGADRQCPHGFRCGSDTLCYRMLDGGAAGTSGDAAGGSGGNPAGGAGGSPVTSGNGGTTGMAGAGGSAA